MLIVMNLTLGKLTKASPPFQYIAQHGGPARTTNATRCMHILDVPAKKDTACVYGTKLDRNRSEEYVSWVHIAKQRAFSN